MTHTGAAPGDLPDDPALPGLSAIRVAGVSGAFPGLGLDGVPVEVVLRAHTPRKRATLEVRAGERHLAIVIHAGDPSPEVELHRALALGLAGAPGLRVPSLVAWGRRRRILGFDRPGGRAVTEPLAEGKGARAGTRVA